MAAVANSPSFAKKAGVPQSVGSDFVQADKGRKFAKGGDTMATKKIFPFMGKETPKEEKREMAVKAKSKAKYFAGEKAEGIHGKSGMKKPTAYAEGGFTKSADGIAENGRTKAQRFAGGNMVAAGGPSMAPKSPTVMGGPSSKMMSPKQIADRPMPSQQDYVKSYVKGPAPIKPPQVSSVNPKPPLGLLINRKPGTGLKDPATKPPAMGKPPLSRPMPDRPSKRDFGDMRYVENRMPQQQQPSNPFGMLQPGGGGAKSPNSVSAPAIGGKNPNAKPTPIPQEFLNFDKNSTVNIKKGGEVKAKKYASGGCVSSKPVKTMARGGGCEVKGKPRGRYI